MNKTLLIITTWTFLILSSVTFAAEGAVLPSSPSLQPIFSVPDALIMPSSNGEREHAIVVEKAKTKLSLLEIRGDNFYLVKEYEACTGKVAGDKQVVGDKKTPEGIYFGVDIREKNRLLPKHGIRAFVLD
jgi:murein L,D-transpeptidase YafK